MLELFIRTFIMVFLVEMGSTSQFVIAGLSAHTDKVWVVWLASVLCLSLTCFLAVMFGKWLHQLPISPNLISGTIMITIGIFLLWKQ